MPRSCPLFPQEEPLTSDDSAFETFSFFIRVHSPRAGLGQTQCGRPFGQSARSSDIPQGEHFLTRNCQAFLETPQQSLTQHTLHTHARTHVHTHAHAHTALQTSDPSSPRYFPSISCESGTVLGAGDTTGNKKDQVCPREQHSPQAHVSYFSSLKT